MDMKKFQSEGIQWFKSAIAPQLGDEYEIKYTSASDGDLGALEAVEFNSEGKGGYVHFWGDGYVGFELVSYESGENIVEDVMIEWANSPGNFDEVLAPLIEGLKR